MTFRVLHLCSLGLYRSSVIFLQRHCPWISCRCSRPSVDNLPGMCAFFSVSPSFTHPLARLTSGFVLKISSHDNPYYPTAVSVTDAWREVLEEYVRGPGFPFILFEFDEYSVLFLLDLPIKWIHPGDNEDPYRGQARLGSTHPQRFSLQNIASLRINPTIRIIVPGSMFYFVAMVIGTSALSQIPFAIAR